MGHNLKSKVWKQNLRCHPEVQVGIRARKFLYFQDYIQPQQTLLWCNFNASTWIARRIKFQAKEWLFTILCWIINYKEKEYAGVSFYRRIFLRECAIRYKTCTTHNVKTQMRVSFDSATPLLKIIWANMKENKYKDIHCSKKIKI